VNQETEKSYSAFLPVLLVALSFVILLGRDLSLTRQQKGALKQMHEQQTVNVEKSRQAQAAFEKLMRDLIRLAQTDQDARAVVTKYNINFTPAQQPAPATTEKK
jgi:hypothetical protein